MRLLQQTTEVPRRLSSETNRPHLPPSRSYIPASTTVIGPSLTFWKDSPDVINFDNVVILMNLPRLQANHFIDPAGSSPVDDADDGGKTVLKALIELLAKSMFMRIGSICSICFSSSSSSSSSSATSQQHRPLNGTAFIEFTTQDEAIKAERILDSFPFALSTSHTDQNPSSPSSPSSAYLGCRRLVVYARSEDLNSSLDSIRNELLESSTEIDLPVSPYSPEASNNSHLYFADEEEEEDGKTSANLLIDDSEYMDIDEAITAALAPLEQYKEEEVRDERKPLTSPIYFYF